ncbi:MAG: PAS domain S-box protein [Vicinamibacterales bacterium]|nr:PAS domain S-box protein [Vicinamibacterales bacterium]
MQQPRHTPITALPPDAGRVLFETAPFGIVYQDRDGVILSANPAAERILGLSVDQMRGRTSADPHWQAIHEDGSPIPGDAHPAILALRSGKTVQNAVMGIFNPEKASTAWIVISAVPLFQPGDTQPFQVYTTFVDLTDLLRQDNRQPGRLRTGTTTGVAEGLSGHVGLVLAYRQAQARLEESLERARLSEAFLSRSQELAHVGSWVLDVKTGRLTWSDEIYRIFGLRPAEFEATYDAFLAHVHPDDRAVVDAAYRTSVQEGHDSYEIGHRVVRQGSGEVRHVHEKAIHECDATGAIVRSVGMVQDITESVRAQEERQRLQAQLIQAQKLESVGRLAGGVAHDFNNMVGVIIGVTEMALERVSPESPLHAELQEIWTAARRSAALTRQLLTFARKQTVAPRLLDLNETVESVLKMLRRLIGENVDLVWEPGARLWSVKIDPTQIDQLLANLCINAHDAIRGPGTITITTKNVACDEQYCADLVDAPPGDYVALAVADNGCGMDRETLGHLFEPFFTTKDVGEGTGLGLATVHGIVAQNGGFVTVASEPGIGSTFFVHLPRHQDDRAQRRDRSPAGPAQPGHETILLVEDEPALLRMTTTMLQRQGYTVLATADPAEALRAAEAHTSDIHLLLTDVVMPAMNGRDLARGVLARHPNIKRLFMSGYPADIIAHDGVLDEGVSFIQKPFSVRDLAAKLRDVLQNRG